MELWLGADIAKATLMGAAALGKSVQEQGKFSNDEAGFEQWHAAIRAAYPEIKAEQIHLVVEPTGSYHLSLVAYAYRQGWQVSLPNPKQVRDWASGVGIRAKTDKQDARLLARFGAERQPAPQQPVPEEVQELDLLVRRKADLEAMVRQEKNRLESLAQRPLVPAGVRANLQRSIERLQEDVAELDGLIKEHLKAHPHLATQVRLLDSCPGVGRKVAVPLLVLLYRWDALTSGQGDARGLTAFAGLDPKPHERGSSVHKRPAISRQGDRFIRHLLYMGALGGIRGQNRLRSTYQHFLARGKPKRLALVALARKILVWALAIFRSGSPFDPERDQPRPLAP